MSEFRRLKFLQVSVILLCLIFISFTSQGTVSTKVFKLISSKRRNGKLRLSVVAIFWCRGHLLGQNFVSSDRERGPLQDEDHSGSRPHSFPGLYLMRSGRAPEWFRSSPVVAGS